MKTLKMGCKVLMLAIAMLVVVGCKDAYAWERSSETVIKMGADEKEGTVVTKMAFDKNQYESVPHTKVGSLEEIIELVKPYINEAYGLKFELDTTDSATDYLTVTMQFDDINDLNQKIDSLYDEQRRMSELASKKMALYAIKNACFEKKDYSEELAKLIQKDGFACSADDEWIKILAHRMLTGQNVNNKEDIQVLKDTMTAVDLSEADIHDWGSLGLDKTEDGYSIYTGIFNVFIHYIDYLAEYNADMFYNIGEMESPLYEAFDKVVYEQFLDTYENDINIPYVMGTCFPGVTDMAEIDSELLLSKLEISESKKEDNIYDMYADKVNVEELYKEPDHIVGGGYDTEYEHFKVIVGDKIYWDEKFFECEWAPDTFYLKEEVLELKEADPEDIKVLNSTMTNNVDLDDTPDTGDGINIYILAGIALLATVGIAITFSINKRRMYV